MKRNVILFIILLIFVGGLGYYFIIDGANIDEETNLEETLPTVEPRVTLTPTPTPTSSPTTETPDNWEEYESENFTLSHPPEMTMSQTESDYIEFTLLGPTQTEGTEIFDGINFLIQTNTLSNQTLQEAAQEKVNNLGPMETLIDPLETVNFETLYGYEYTTESLGEYTHYILTTDNSNIYFDINVLTADPENLGYQETVENMINSLGFE